MTDHVLHDISNGVLTLTLNRPEKKNALTRAMYQALADGIDGAGRDTEVRCVLIQAEGDMFTAGNDLATSPRPIASRQRTGRRATATRCSRRWPEPPRRLWRPSTAARSASGRPCCSTAIWSSCPTMCG